MREKRLVRGLLIFLSAYMILVSAQPRGMAFGPENTAGNQASESYQAASWALGMVVPQGANLADGSRLEWENVANVSATVSLPRIEYPDLPVFVVLSLMTADGSVLQVAAGVLKSSELWEVYADYDTKVGTVNPEYDQILNSSQPLMSPGAKVRLSLLRSSTGGWSLEVVDTETAGQITSDFPSADSSLPKVGDQEVVALESYSKNETTFQNMGNLTLNALLVDGQPVSGGFYTYGAWDPSHNPLYVVGSLGTSPPLFVSLVKGSSATLVWSYATQLVGGSEESIRIVPELTLPLAFGLLSMVAAVLVVKELKRRRVPLASRAKN